MFVEDASFIVRRSQSNCSFVGIAYGNSMFVAAASDGSIWTSSNGSTWSMVFDNPIYIFRTVRFLNGAFYVVASSYYLTSTDGVNWTSYLLTDPTLTSLDGSSFNPAVQANILSMMDMTYHAGTYVAVGSIPIDAFSSAAVIMKSTDGINWRAEDTTSLNAVTPFLQSVQYFNSQYVLTGQSGLFATSPDATTWTIQTGGALATATGTLYPPVFNGTTYVLPSDSGAVYSSADFVTWTLHTVGSQNYPAALTVGSTFYLFGSSASIYTSTDASTWTLNYGLTKQGFTGAAYSGTTFVAVGASNSLIYGTDGAVWHTVFGLDNGQPLQAAVQNGTRTVGVGYAGHSYFLISDDDGVSWSGPYNWTTNFIYSVTYGSALYVASSSGGVIYTSPDGITWTQQTSNTSNQLRCVRYLNGNFVAVGDNGTIVTSTNGTAWTVQTTPAGVSTLSLRGAAFGTSTYVVVGDSGNVLTSTDLVTWTQQTAVTGTPQLNTVVFDGTDFIAGGSNSATISTSSDGVTWTNQTVTDLGNITALTFDGTTLYAAGTATLATSTDHGVTWTNLCNGYNTASNFYCVVNGTARLIAGSTDDILYSTDSGANWFYARKRRAMYGLGYDGTTYFATGFGCIQTSSDALTWTAPKYLSGNLNINDFVHANLKYVAVGNNGLVLTSTDGSNWTWNRWNGSTRSTSTHHLNAITYGTEFVAVGANGLILTSPDASTWTTQTDPSGGLTFTNIAYGNGIYLGAVEGTDGKYIKSSDGATWSIADLPGQDATHTIQVKGIYFDGTQFIISGYMISSSPSYTQYSVLLKTTDGTTYTTTPLSSAVATPALDVDYINAWIATKFQGLDVVLDFGGGVLTSYDGTNYVPVQLFDNYGFGFQFAQTKQLGTKLLIATSKGEISQLSR